MSVGPGEEASPGDAPGWDPHSVARVALLWLVAVNMRSVLLALPPVLPQIHNQLHLSETEVGLLTTLPVLLLGLGAFAGSAAVARLGARRTLVAGLAVVAAASAVRGVGDDLALFGGAVLLGLAIAVLQPALPSIAQAWFGDRVGVATTIYGNGFLVGEAVAASITLPFVVPLVGGWQGAIAVWSIPCAVLAVVFLTPIGSVPAVSSAHVAWLPDVRNRWTWRLGAFQAGGSSLYFGTNAFIPTELHAVGHASLVAPCLASLNISQLAGALGIAVLAQRGARTRPVMVGFGSVAVGGLLLFAFLPGPLAVVGAGFVGLCSAAAFVVALALVPLVSGPAEVHRVAAGMFSIGYISAFALPLVGGVLWDSTDQPRTAFIPSLLGAVLVATMLARRPRGASDPIARLSPAAAA
jgi:MFS transporter, CP family, cyanate transporter